LDGALQLSSRDTYALIQQLEAQGLVQPHNRELALTTDGQLWALQIVRAHRLWERYLADEARLPLDKIHTEAHRREHGMTAEQVNELDAALGHPISDPHGDPIPTRECTFRPLPSGTPLTAWKMGEPGQIVHLEDEPPLAYAQIVAEGLRLGQVVHILEVTGERVMLTDGEKEYTLAPAVAANVFMEALPEAQRMPEGTIPLAELAPTRKAQIVALDASCQGFTRRRFLDLGLTPGTRIFPELENSFGDPRAYRIRGTLIALRKDQAGLIWVLPEAS
jgi:DtxR family Mn-dependent transcriptional regulator